MATPERHPVPMVVRLLRAHREAQGISQRALAVTLGVSQATVATWETGRSMPGIDSVEAYARAVGYRVTLVPGYLR